MDKSFEDIKSLLNNAEEMVELAKKLKNSQNEEIDDLFGDLGIVSHISKKNLGSKYYLALAEQMEDFLIRPLETKDGILSLTEIFCIYNKTKVTNFISPGFYQNRKFRHKNQIYKNFQKDDLINALRIVDEKSKKMKLKKFSSGLNAVVLTEIFEKRTLYKKFEKFAKEKEHFTVFEICSIFGLSYGIANDLIMEAESDLILCRDETDFGTMFYENKFLH
ncbi:Vacuolar protein-sorting-associated protein 36, variant 2 [Bonamia ostreae]|uniref:Vacuolar protein-sorting-associated protein 36 n=1 Tax=Bonamia ostreae TaxID=126728 RepID=A0ABV2AJH8_9EUKA